jgi:alpha-D-xyloside xylohydrolase
MFTSHVRSHGTPPKEPWEYGEDFMNAFRDTDNLRYRLMPYIYAQAKECTEKGLPMVRAIFIEFPEDPGSWLVDNEYLFGSQMLVAPLFDDKNSREVYLPVGKWIDYQTGKVYDGGWHKIEAGKIPIILLIRDGSVIPHIKLAQSTKFMDWSELEMKVYETGLGKAEGKIYLPGDIGLKTVIVEKTGGKYVLKADPFAGKVKWKIN